MFAPAESLALWRLMAAQRTGSTPEFASTHPLHETRIKQIQEWLPEVMKERPGGDAVER